MSELPFGLTVHFRRDKWHRYVYVRKRERIDEADGIRKTQHRELGTFIYNVVPQRAPSEAKQYLSYCEPDERLCFREYYRTRMDVNVARKAKEYQR